MNTSTTGVLRFVGVNQPRLFVIGNAFQRWMDPAMKLIGAQAQQTIRVLGQVARPDWITRSGNIVDAKLGQSLDFNQLQVFVNWATQSGASITYVTLSAVPADIANRAIAIGAANGVAVKFVELWPF